MTKPLSHLRAALIALSEHPPSDPVEAGIAADCARRIQDCVAQLDGVMRQRRVIFNREILKHAKPPVAFEGDRIHGDNVAASIANYHASSLDKVACACGLPPLGHVTGHEMRGLDFYGEGGE